MTVPPNIVDLLVEQAEQLGRIEGKLEGLVTSAEFESSMGALESRVSAVESAISTSQFWIVAAIALVGILPGILSFARYLLERRSAKADPDPGAQPIDRTPSLRPAETLP